MYHVEPAFWLVVVFTSQNVGSVANGIFQLDVHARVASKFLSHVEWLRQETLDAASPSNDLLLVVRQFFHTEDGDDILQFFVLLQHSLHLARHAVMFLTNDFWVERIGAGIQHIDSWVNTNLRQGTVHHDGRVQVSEGRRWRWIGQVVGRHIHRLNRGNRTLFG